MSMGPRCGAERDTSRSRERSIRVDDGGLYVDAIDG